MTSRAPDGLAVIVATRNRSADLERLLEGLTACAPPLGRPWELLVVDNGSTDDTPAVLAAFRGRLPLRALHEERAGKSRAVNAGIRAAPQPLLAFTDDDAIVGPSWLRAIERAAGTHADALGFGGRVIPEWAAAPPRWLVGEGGRALTRTNGGVVAYDIGGEVRRLAPDVRPLIGANYAFRRAAFERHGLFREDLGPGTGTSSMDTDFVKRLLHAGELLLYVPDLVVRHAVAPERVRRGYGVRWSFRLGRGAARMRGRRDHWRGVRGVPLFAVRVLLRDAVRLARAGGAPRSARAYDALKEVAYDWGMVYEYARLPGDFDPARRVPWLAPGRAPAPAGGGLAPAGRPPGVPARSEQARSDAWT